MVRSQQGPWLLLIHVSLSKQLKVLCLAVVSMEILPENYLLCTPGVLLTKRLQPLVDAAISPNLQH